jgi:hypothetical protein
MARLHMGAWVHTTIWWLDIRRIKDPLGCAAREEENVTMGVQKGEKENEFPGEELGFVVQSCNGRGEHIVSNSSITAFWGS